MYEDLARTQDASALERFVMTSLVPSLLVTSLLHADTVWTRPTPATGPRCLTACYLHCPGGQPRAWAVPDERGVPIDSGLGRRRFPG